MPSDQETKGQGGVIMNEPGLVTIIGGIPIDGRSAKELEGRGCAWPTKILGRWECRIQGNVQRRRIPE